MPGQSQAAAGVASSHTRSADDERAVWRRDPGGRAARTVGVLLLCIGGFAVLASIPIYSRWDTSGCEWTPPTERRCQLRSSRATLNAVRLISADPAVASSRRFEIQIRLESGEGWANADVVCEPRPHRGSLRCHVQVPPEFDSSTPGYRSRRERDALWIRGLNGATHGPPRAFQVRAGNRETAVGRSIARVGIGLGSILGLVGGLLVILGVRASKPPGNRQAGPRST
jgi:hypothetical protein